VPISSDPGGGVLATVVFHVNNIGLPTIPTASQIDLAMDASLTSQSFVTSLADQSGANYDLTSSAFPPTNNATQLNPPSYVYGGPADPNDGTISITDANMPPAAVNDAYSITEREVAADPALNIAAPGVLANDSSPQSDPLTSSLLTPPAHGSLSL